MGWIADRIGSADRALMWLRSLSGGTTIAIAGLGPGSAALWVIAVSVLAGLTVISWNGVFVTGIAEATPEGRVSEMTGASACVLFAGMVVAPLIMQAMTALTGGYAVGWMLAGTMPLFAGLYLWRS